MRHPIPMISARLQIATYRHVYVPTTDLYYPGDHDVHGDEPDSSRLAQSDEPPRQPAQSESKKDVAPRTPRASPKSRRD